MAETKGFLHRIRGNAEWEVVKFLGGSGMLTSVWQTISAFLHHAKPDWILWGIVFLLGGVLSVLGYWRQRKDFVRIGEPPNGEEHPSREELDADAEQKRWQEWANSHNLNFYVKTGVEASRLFTPLQMEAFQVAKQLQTLIVQIPPVPLPKKFSNIADAYDDAFSKGTSHYQEELNKAQAQYARVLAPRIKDLVLRMRHQGCAFDPWLDHWVSGNWSGNPPNELILKPIHDTLIVMVHELDGVKLTITTLPRTI